MRQPRSMRWFVLLIFVSGSTGCVTVPKLPAVADGQRITIEYQPGGPICAPCESLEIVMTSDGRAIWTHGHGSWDTFENDRYKLPFSREDFLGWNAYLHHFRPSKSQVFGANSEVKTCETAYFDMPGRMIKWETHQETVYLNLDLGCDSATHAELITPVPPMNRTL